MSRNPWITEFKGPKAKDANAYRVFSFSCAGGSIVDFRALDVELPTWIRIIGMELPGHMTRITEPFIATVQEAAAAAAAVIESYIRGLAVRPLGIALLGHSLGTLVAYEACRVLESKADAFLKPSMIFACATDPPHHRGGCPARYSKLAAITDPEEFIYKHLESFPDSRLLELYKQQPRFAMDFAKILQADVHLLHRYDISAKTPGFSAKVNAKIVPFYGLGDDEFAPEDMQEWGLYSNVPPKPTEVFEGGHHFIKNPAQVPKIAAQIEANFH